MNTRPVRKQYRMPCPKTYGFTAEDIPVLLTSADVCSRFKIGARTLRRWTSTGAIRRIVINGTVRFHPDMIMEDLEKAQS